MTTADSTGAEGSTAGPGVTATAGAPGTAAHRQNLLIGVCAVVVGTIVIPYGASMPDIREGVPGPGLFPMMIGGLLVLFGVLLPLTGWLGARRDLRHRAALAAARGTGAGATGAAAAGADDLAPAGPSGLSEEAFALPGAAVRDASDTPVEELETTGVLDTDVGSDGARRWINGAILMGGILAYVLLAEHLGFPLTMAALVIAIVRSLRSSWLTAVLTGILTSLGLWALFERILLVQLPDGLIEGF